GHFPFLMGGGSPFPGFEPLMKVSGTVTGGAAEPTAGTATFTGSGKLNLGPSGRMDALFLVPVAEGGAGPVGAAKPTAGPATFPGSGTPTPAPSGRMDAFSLAHVRGGGAGVGEL